MTDQHTAEQKIELVEYLSQFVTPERKSRFDQVIKSRTRHLTIVLEDIFQSHNISAVLRSCDCFGVQDVHIIENNNEFMVNPDIALGASKWLTIHQYNQKKLNTEFALKKLKQSGYRIIATTPHNNDCCIDDLDISKKTALVFGTELSGISETVIQHADGYVKIPMVGFTESFNISVSVALFLFNLTERIRKSEDKWELSAIEKTDILLEWLRNSIQSAEAIERKFVENNFNQKSGKNV